MKHVPSVKEIAERRAAPVVTADEVRHMQELLRRLQQDPLCGAEMLEQERAFLKDMVKAMRLTGTKASANFERIVKLYNLE